jgi:hypothetical protein
VQVGFAAFVQPLSVGIRQILVLSGQLSSARLFAHLFGVVAELQQYCPAPQAPLELLGPAPPQIESVILRVDPQIRGCDCARLVPAAANNPATSIGRTATRPKRVTLTPISETPQPLQGLHLIATKAA